ncbi:MAG: nickel pincer cofactor biosynthesis protein LarC [Nitrospinota bacterium]|nr:nickel pincer cofactor biosynthesis protein LarC [Nitrospinota bacterium]
MRIAYFDCHSGISGDMILGALIDAGVKLQTLRQGLASLGLKGYELKSRRVKRGLFGGTKIDVVLSPKTHSHSRTLSDIERLLKRSTLAKPVVQDATEIFLRLGKAEAKVHRTSIDKVHFHEVGAVDSIVDIVGGVIGMQELDVDQVLASPLNTGEGMVKCEHGVLPVPAPATLELLKGIPCYSSGIPHELTTPTGAAMIGFWADAFQSLPLMKIQKTGYGAGSHILKEHANLLRVILGEAEGKGGGKIILVETNIDDMNPEFYDHIMDSLYSAGALDVYLTSIQMKKNRPAVKISVLAPPTKRETVAHILLTETSTFGIRFTEMDRIILERQQLEVQTPYGKVAVKVGSLDGQVIHFSPEYENCKQIARKKKIPVKTVYDTALQTAEKKLKGGS